VPFEVVSHVYVQLLRGYEACIHPLIPGSFLMDAAAARAGAATAIAGTDHAMPLAMVRRPTGLFGVGNAVSLMHPSRRMPLLGMVMVSFDSSKD